MASGGQMTFSGSLADGTSVGPASTPVCRFGYVPLYVPLYSGKGSVWSWLSFDTNLPSMDLSLTNKLSLSLTLSSGTFAGGVREPGMTRSNSFKGVLLRDENSGYGYFLETNRSGRVLFWPGP